MSEPRVLGGRYELGAVVGRGGMAEVHQGRDVRLERDVAVKTLRTDLARDPTFQARFRREAQSAAQLNHPAVVAVYDTGEELVDGTATPYIVMEYVDGQTLRDVLQDTQRLMPDRALEIMTGVLKALSYSHRMGIVHRDIKPANVMLTKAGEIKVMDFGIARSVSDAQATMTQTAQVIGTAQYLSPEQARGEKVDARSDLYSTGCVLYELLTGNPPFSGDSPVAVAYQHVREDPTPPSHLNPDVPPSVDAIALKALAKNPDNRYANADEMRADMERALGGLPVHATPVLDNDPTEYLGGAAATTLLPSGAGDDGDRGPRRRRRKKNRKPLIFTLLALGLVVAVILGFVAWGATQNDQQGPQQVTVPDVVGQAAGPAAAELKSAGFEVDRERKYDKTVDEGNVISQDPAGDTRATEGSPVTLTVSRGAQQVTVPPLVGKSRSEAKVALDKAGLGVGDIAREPSNKKKGTVLESDPASGEQVPDDSEVNLVLSSGQIEVPDVISQQEGEAKAELTQAGFDVRTVTQEDGDAEPGEVIAQSPDGGELRPKGSRVTITVAKEPDVPTEDDPTNTTSPPSTDDPEPTPTIDFP